MEVEYQCNQIRKINVPIFDLVYEKIIDKKERDKVFEKLSDFLKLPKEVFSHQYIIEKKFKNSPNKDIVDFFMNREYLYYCCTIMVYLFAVSIYALILNEGDSMELMKVFWITLGCEVPSFLFAYFRGIFDEWWKLLIMLHVV